MKQNGTFGGNHARMIWGTCLYKNIGRVKIPVFVVNGFDSRRVFGLVRNINIQLAINNEPSQESDIWELKEVNKEALR